MLFRSESLLAFDTEGREVGHSALESCLRGVRMPGDDCEVVAQTEHTSELSNLVLGSLVDAEVMQALGRGRALRRTEKTPLHVLLLADRVVDATFNEVVRADAVLPSAHTAMLIGQGTAPTKAKAAWGVGAGLFGSLEQAQRWAEGSGGADRAGQAYWLTALNKALPKSETVKLPQQHTQTFNHLGKLERKLRRIFGVRSTGKKGGAVVFRREHDKGDLDAPVVVDKRSPGSQITRRKALELWRNTQTQANFAQSLSNQIGQPVNRASARTILKQLKPFLPPV